MKYFQLILWGLFFAGSIVLFVRFNRRMRRDYYLKTAIKAVLKKQQQLPGRSFFSTYVLAQALFPLLKSRKKEEAKTREALIKGNLLTTADSCCGTESLLSSAKGIGGAGKNCKSTSSGQYRTDFDRLPPFYSRAKRGRPSDFGQYGHLKGLGLCQSHAFLSANSF